MKLLNFLISIPFIYISVFEFITKYRLFDFQKKLYNKKNGIKTEA